MITRTESASGLVDSVDRVDRVDEEEEIETMVSQEQRDRPATSMEDRLREVDDRLHSPRDAQSTPLRNRFSVTRVLRGSDPPQRSEVLTSPALRNGVATPPAGPSPPAPKSGSSGGRMGKVRQPIPLEFQNGRLVSGLVLHHVLC